MPVAQYGVMYHHSASIITGCDMTTTEASIWRFRYREVLGIAYAREKQAIYLRRVPIDYLILQHE